MISDDITNRRQRVASLSKVLLKAVNESCERDVSVIIDALAEMTMMAKTLLEQEAAAERAASNDRLCSFCNRDGHSVSDCKTRARVVAKATADSIWSAITKPSTPIVVRKGRVRKTAKIDE